MEILYIQRTDDAYTSHDPYDWFCAPGSHISEDFTVFSDGLSTFFVTIGYFCKTLHTNKKTLHQISKTL